ncbi:MAG: UDP-N-acetylglucosamine 1-carboxyvinyltransferase, partial [Actinomycetota bacterium]
MKNEFPRIIVRRGAPLSGSVQVPGAKNSVLKLMAATLLAEGDFVFTNVPSITDVHKMAETLSALGVSSEWLGPHELKLTNSGNITPEVPFERLDKMRASINVLGPLLSHYGSARINWPGGDDFGGRPIDLHIAGLQKMGATVEEGLYDIFAFADRLKGTNIELALPSVGATENLLTAAVYARGVTVIDNAAREP